MTPLRLLALLFVATLAAGLATAQPPTHADLRYDPGFERSTLDLWLPAGEALSEGEAAPLMVYFHGGGFRRGSKRWLPAKIRALTAQGVAVASVGYPLLGDEAIDADTEAISQVDYVRIMEHTTGAIRFLKQKAGAYRLDPERVAVAGSSAGALISEYLTYQAGLGVGFCVALQQPYPVDRVVAIIDADEPPLLLFTASGPDDRVHSPSYAEQIKEHCDKVGVGCTLLGSPQSGLPTLPEGESLTARVMTIWSACGRSVHP